LRISSTRWNTSEEIARGFQVGQKLFAVCIYYEDISGCRESNHSELRRVGPEVTGISSNVPEGCSIDQAAFVSRHASRYPDQSAYNQWTNLSARIHATRLSASASELEFLSTWQPVLPYPDQEIAQISITGYRELYDMGVTYRFRYGPHFYKDNTDFTMWANLYKPSPRVTDSARLFARGYMGPNSTLGNIFAINSTDPRSVANSLAPSDLCPLYADNGGSPEIDTWQNIYLPPIQKRLNREIHGGFQFTQSDVSLIPYLCGFETQIIGSRSPFCNIFTRDEILQYEYAQDLRYWYGTGLGTDIEKDMMLPFLSALVGRFIDGPGKTYKSSDGTSFTPSSLIATFTNDGQINQLAAAIGVFDGQSQLPATHVPQNRLFKASNFVTMRGTITFERLNCERGKFIRLRLNDIVYPVSGCQSGPGRSCSLTQYQSIVQSKSQRAGDFQRICNITSSVVPIGKERTTFLTDISLPYGILYKP
jgi:acid phosphatase